MKLDHFKTIEFADIRNWLNRAICLVLVQLLLAAGSAHASDLAEEKADEQPVYKYTGNSFSLKFHRPSCKFARAMWREHIVRFNYRQQAIDAGQRPCRYCLPPYWKSVGAQIIGYPSSVVIQRRFEAGWRPALSGSANDVRPNGSGSNAGTLKLEESQQTEVLEPGSTSESIGMRATALPLNDTANQQLPKEPTSQCAAEASSRATHGVAPIDQSSVRPAAITNSTTLNMRNNRSDQPTAKRPKK